MKIGRVLVTGGAGFLGRAILRELTDPTRTLDASPEEIHQSGKISPFDIAETATYLATLGPNAIVHRIIVDRLGAEW